MRRRLNRIIEPEPTFSPPLAASCNVVANANRQTPKQHLSMGTAIDSGGGGGGGGGGGPGRGGDDEDRRRHPEKGGGGGKRDSSGNRSSRDDDGDDDDTTTTGAVVSTNSHNGQDNNSNGDVSVMGWMSAESSTIDLSAAGRTISSAWAMSSASAPAPAPASGFAPEGSRGSRGALVENAGPLPEEPGAFMYRGNTFIRRASDAQPEQLQQEQQQQQQQQQQSEERTRGQASDSQRRRSSDIVVVAQAELVEDHGVPALDDEVDSSGIDAAAPAAAAEDDNNDDNNDQNGNSHQHGSTDDGIGGLPADLVLHATAESKFVRRFSIGRHDCAINMAYAAAMAVVVASLSVGVAIAAANRYREGTPGPPLTEERVLEVLLLSTDPKAGPEANGVPASPYMHAEDQLVDALEDADSPQSKAVDWLVHGQHGELYVHPDDSARILQRYALATLYFASTGEVGPGRDSKGAFADDGSALFLGAGDECDWGLTQCLEGETITEINLAYAGLTGYIPDDIGYLDGLRNFYATGNALHGTLPSSFGLMSGLNELSLHENYLVGTLPSEMGQLTSLTLVLLSRNALTGTVPLSFGNLSNLEWFFSDQNANMTGSLNHMCDIGINYFIADCTVETCTCCTYCG